MEDFLKVLRPVLTTADNYLPGNVFSDAEIQSRVKTSIFQSIPDPKCNYVSFIQVSPDGGADKSLSWKLEQGNAPSVIQFLTTQLNFRIEWTFVNNSELDLNQKVRFLEVDVPKQIGPEPWDSKGNRIVFSVPKPGQTTSGCFVVPGQYQFFVIEDPGKNLDITLKVTGFYPKCKIDRWAVVGDRESKFCIKDCNGKSLWAYTNKVSTLGRIQREINPLLLSYQEKVLREYYFNAGQPCFAGERNLNLKTSNEVIITVKSDLSNNNNYIGSQYFDALAVYGCGNSYCAPKITLSDNSLVWISIEGDQIMLINGSYRLDQIEVTGRSQTQEEVNVPFNPSEPIITGPFYGCEEVQDLALLFYSFTDNQPQKYLPGSNPPPTVQDANGTMVMLLSQIDEGFFQLNSDSTNFFNFKTYENTDKFPYGIRLNSPMWYYLTSSNNGLFNTRYFGWGPGQLTATMKLSKI